MEVIEEILHEYFEFDQIFDLLDYAHDMEKLHQDLLPLVRECYQDNYRFVFKFDDTDYHISLDQPGLTMRNLQSLLFQLDISNYFCIIVTTNSIKDQLLCLQKEITDEHAIYSIKHALKPSLQLFRDTDVNCDPEKIVKHFVSLNGRERDHRKIWCALLKHHDLLHKGIVSYGVTPGGHTTHPQAMVSSLPVLDQPFLYPRPFTTINDKIIIRDQAVRNIVSNTHIESNYKNFDDQFGLYSDNAAELLQQALINVVTETVCKYPDFYISEKTFKPISTMRPFLVISSRHSLSELKTLGFKTFDRWWDESYDQLEDPVDRILAVFNILKNISKYSVSDLRDLCSEMSDVLHYNYHYYKNHFYHNEVEKFHKSCQKNLGMR